MMQVFQIRSEKRSAIPAVTHADGSGRLQTVARSSNPRYYRLIESFHKLSGVPMVLNTSFNENEPVVCTPQQALDCFLRTHMDVLVLGDVVLHRSNGTAVESGAASSVEEIAHHAIDNPDRLKPCSSLYCDRVPSKDES
jgi:hypothetical protein